MRDTFEERIARVARRMVPGGFGGRTEQVAPVRTPSGRVSTYRPPPKTSTALRYATVIVAAADSLNPTAADFTCTGTDDGATLSAALTALGGNPGTVLLMEGQYNLGAFMGAGGAAIGALAAGQEFRGLGWGTQIVIDAVPGGAPATADGMLFVAGEGAVRDLTFVVQGSTTYSGPIIYLDGGPNQVTNVRFNITTGNTDWFQGALVWVNNHPQSAAQNLIDGCEFWIYNEQPSYAIQAIRLDYYTNRFGTQQTELARVVNNSIYVLHGAVTGVLSDADFSLISNNAIWLAGSAGTGVGINLDTTSTNNVVVSNAVKNPSGGTPYIDSGTANLTASNV